MATQHGLLYGDTLSLYNEEFRGFVCVPHILDPSPVVLPVDPNQIVPQEFERCIFQIKHFDESQEGGGDSRKEVKFGQVVKLLHVTLDKYLSCRRKVNATRENTNWKVSLERSGDKSTKGVLWRVMPRLKIRAEGEPIFNSDEVVFELFQADERLHVATSLEAGHHEVNASSMFSSFVVRFFGGNPEPNVFSGGDGLICKHLEVGAFLGVEESAGDYHKVVLMSTDVEMDAGAESGDPNHSATPSNAMFLVEHENPLDGSPLTFHQPCRLKSIPRRQYLSIEPTSLCGREEQTTFLDNIGDSIFQEFQDLSDLFTLTLVDEVSNPGTLFSFAPTSMSGERQIMTGARVTLSSSAYGVSIGLKPTTDRDLLDSAPSEYQERPKLVVCNRSFLSNGFELENLYPTDYLPLSVVLSFAPDLNAYIESWSEEEQPDHATVDRMISALKSLIYYCSESDELDPIIRSGRPILAHQRLVVDQGLHTLCVEALRVPFVSVLTHQSLVRRECSEILYVCKLCYKLIRQAIRGNSALSIDMKQHIPFIQSQLGNSMGAEEALTELFRDNKPLITQMVNIDQITYILNLLEEHGFRAEYIRFLQTLCECNEEGLPRQQNLVLSCLLSGGKSRVLKMDVHSRLPCPTPTRLNTVRKGNRAVGPFWPQVWID